MLLGWLSPITSSQSLLLSLICLVEFNLKQSYVLYLLSSDPEVLCADFVMEKGKSESSERSFGESESVVSSQSDIQVRTTHY